MPTMSGIPVSLPTKRPLEDMEGQGASEQESKSIKLEMKDEPCE